LPNETERICERFYTADPNRSKRSSGLGFYISRKLKAGMVQRGEAKRRRAGSDHTAAEAEDA
jgi:signal transduction histidine kinase